MRLRRRLVPRGLLVQQAFAEREAFAGDLVGNDVDGDVVPAGRDAVLVIDALFHQLLEMLDRFAGAQARILAKSLGKFLVALLECGVRIDMRFARSADVRLRKLLCT